MFTFLEMIVQKQLKIWDKTHKFLGPLYKLKNWIDKRCDCCVTMSHEQCPACLEEFSEENPEQLFTYEKVIHDKTGFRYETVKTNICRDCAQDSNTANLPKETKKHHSLNKLKNRLSQITSDP